MCSYPDDVKEGLDVLGHHYTDFEENIRGANGYLFFATNKVSYQKVAIKFYYGQPGERQHDEPRQLAAIISPNVLQILDAKNINDELSYFVTPFCNEGDIDDLIRSQPSAHRAINVATAICQGVSAIHAKQMVHRDLKPGNIVLDNGIPKIADFGSVRAIEEGKSTTCASRHSILYRPPESFTENQYGKCGDVYQIGLLTYQMLGGKLSYDGEDYLTRKDRIKYKALSDLVDRSILLDDAIESRICDGTLVNFSSLPPWVSSSTKQCLKSLIALNVGDRISMVSEAAARLSRVRSTLCDWRWNDGIASLSQQIEVRPVGGEQYEAFHLGRTGSVRRMQGVSRGTLQQVVNQVSAKQIS
ncbi:MAG: protein kinase [Magnetococcales bacterium]|nr:protein kinase [Magnetococcales bacterium]MBF0115173.1 protein kinase [Magnetococcales bacterium]